MGDITDLFSSNGRTKVTPTKGYQANFTTTSTNFVDVTSLSVSVPNNAFYVVRGILGANSASMTATLQVLLGASVVFTVTESSGGGSGATVTIDSIILQNTTGSTQTAKVQLKSDNGSNTASAQTMSIIQGTFILPFDAQNYATREGWQDISSLDFVSCIGNGTTYINFDGVEIKDSTTTAVTWNTLEKFCSNIKFYGTTVGYVGFDFSGKYLTL